MKSTDKKILILVASLALLLAGCGGGGSSTTAPVDPGPTPAETAIMQAETALEAAQAAVSGAMTDAEMRDAYRAVQQAADSLVMALKASGGSPAAVEAATTTRQTAMHMADNLAQKIADAQAAADAAMAKLYAAIGPYPFGDSEGSFPPPAGTDTGISNTGVLTVHNVSINVPQAATGPQLKEDKSAMVPPLHGWTGSRHTATVAAGTYITPGNPDSGNIGAGTYTAHLYSDVGEPSHAPKFNAGPGTTGVGFLLVNNRVLLNGPGVPNFPLNRDVPERIASPQFDHTAGTKTFKLPVPNPSGETIINIRGSYYGVEGRYDCEHL